MTLDKFAEINLSVSDENILKLNELALTLPYIERSILTHYTEKIDISFDPIMDQFIKEFECDPIIVRIKPASHLIWHRDISPYRTCVINVPLKNYDNHATYITNQDIQKAFGQRNAFPDETVNPEIHKPYLVPYKYKQFYVLNVAEKYHCVFNCSDEYRYLLSIPTGKISYQQGVDYFMKLGLINQ